MNKHTVGRLVALTLATLLLAGCVSDGHYDAHQPLPENRVFLRTSVWQGTWDGYITDVPWGTTKLVVELYDLNQDADLYVESPQGLEACESFAPGSGPELCVFYNPSPGPWYVEVAGWGYGKTYYTLASTLQPSYQQASLFAADRGIFSTSLASTSHEQLTQQADTAAGHLGILAAAWERAMVQSQAQASYDILSGADMIGEATLLVEQVDGQRTVHIKAMARDPLTGQRYAVQTRDRHPLLSVADGMAPAQGMATVRMGDTSSTVRLGMDTGTGADVQLVTVPGPVVTEHAWGSVSAGGIRLEMQ